MANTVQNKAVSGFATVVGIAKEATYATAVAASTYLPVETAQFSASNKLIQRNPVRQSKAEAMPGLGLLEAKGDLQIRLDPVSAGIILAQAMGTEVISDGTTAYTVGGVSVSSADAAKAFHHTFTLGAQNTATFSVDFGRNSVAQYTGCKVDQLDITAKAGDDVMMKATLMGQTVALLSSQSLTPNFTDVTPFEWGNLVTATINGQAFDATELSVTLKNNVKPMYTASSGRFAKAMNEMQAQVSGTFTLPYNSDYINSLLWGANAGPTSGIASGNTIVLTFQHATHITGTAVPYILVVTLNGVVLQEAPQPISAKNEVMQSVKFTASETAPGAADSIKIELVNDATTVY